MVNHVSLKIISPIGGDRQEPPWELQSRVTLQNSPSLHKSSVLNIGDKAATICLQKKDLRNCEKISFNHLTNMCARYIFTVRTIKGGAK